jgi:hypothetical protein
MLLTIFYCDGIFGCYTVASEASTRTTLEAAKQSTMDRATATQTAAAAAITEWDMLSLRLALRTMCGSRTGGWSLPCVMSG